MQIFSGIMLLIVLVIMMLITYKQKQFLKRDDELRKITGDLVDEISVKEVERKYRKFLLAGLKDDKQEMITILEECSEFIPSDQRGRWHSQVILPWSNHLQC